MEFFSIFYALMFVVLGFVGYLCCSGIPRFRKFSTRTFIAILTFGASSYIGFLLVIVLVGSPPLRGLLDGRYKSVAYTLAYLVPGFIGSWLALWSLSLTIRDLRKYRVRVAPPE
jgi:hypothetical protein